MASLSECRWRVPESMAAWGELFLLSYEQISQHLELQSKGSASPYSRQLHRTQERASPIGSPGRVAGILSSELCTCLK